MENGKWEIIIMEELAIIIKNYLEIRRNVRRKVGYLTLGLT